MNPIMVPRKGVGPVVFDRARGSGRLPFAKWTFRPLRSYRRGSARSRERRVAAKRALGEDALGSRAHALDSRERRDRVVRFAEPRFEAVGRMTCSAPFIASRGRPSEVMFAPATRAQAVLSCVTGQRILFFADKVKLIVDDCPMMIEPLTSLWDDVPFQGIAKEGGVVFVRNKKPERLIHRILSMVTDPGDWVLDPFLGSGTTAAVAHKMGRKWIGVEEGAHAIDMARERLARVVRGEDPTGMTRELSYRRGGGFGVYR